LTQALAVVASRSSVQAYGLGLSLALSSLALLVVLLLQSMTVLGRMLNHHVLSAALRIVSVAASVSLAAASVSLPRRPDVFFDDRVVDRMRTVNAYSRFTFGWCSNILAIAKKKRDLEATDLSRPDHDSRAKDKAAAWNKMGDKYPLWRSLLWAYKGPLIVQWTMCIFGSLLAYLPQWFTLQILKTLERRIPGERLGDEVWFLVVWMGIATISTAV
jgi:hypothetical protein